MRTNKRTARNNKKIRRGISLFWTIAFIMGLVAIGGLVIDASRVYMSGHQLQIAADSAALAGSRLVAWDPNSTSKIIARLKAQEYSLANDAANLPVNIALNESNLAAGDIVIGRWIPQSQTFIPTLKTPNAMRVVTRKDAQQNPKLPLVFGSMFGVGFSHIEKYATAQIFNASGAAVIALSNDEVGLTLKGTPAINISNSGSIYSNTVETSADFRGNPSTEVAEINLVGDASVSGQNFNPEELEYQELPAVMNTDMPPIADPYAALPEPTYSTTPDLGTISASGTYEPGYYSGGVQVTTGTVNLNPGIYILDGTKTQGGLSVTGGTITANGVLFFVIGGSVDIRGNTVMTLTPPSSGTYAGVSIFQKRDYLAQAEINGEGNLNLTGVLYFPDNKLLVQGNGDTIGTQLIANTIEIDGTGLINIPYNGSPEIAQSSFLVE